MSRRGAGAFAIGCAVIALIATGCVPEPAATGGGTSSAAPGGTTAPSSPASSPEPSTVLISVPADCAAAYSPAMTAALTAELPPLNDPGVELLSSQNGTAAEVLASGAPTLRCTWGAAGAAGLSTNVTAVADAEAARVRDALLADGFTCTDQDDGIVCRAERTTLDFDDNPVTTGEEHFLGPGGWVATSYVGALPAGYTDDVVGVVWG